MSNATDFNDRLAELECRLAELELSKVLDFSEPDIQSAPYADRAWLGLVCHSSGVPGKLLKTLLENGEVPGGKELADGQVIWNRATVFEWLRTFTKPPATAKKRRKGKGGATL